MRHFHGTGGQDGVRYAAKLVSRFGYLAANDGHMVDRHAAMGARPAGGSTAPAMLEREFIAEGAGAILYLAGDPLYPVDLDAITLATRN